MNSGGGLMAVCAPWNDTGKITNILRIIRSILMENYVTQPRISMYVYHPRMCTMKKNGILNNMNTQIHNILYGYIKQFGNNTLMLIYAFKRNSNVKRNVKNVKTVITTATWANNNNNNNNNNNTNASDNSNERLIILKSNSKTSNNNKVKPKTVRTRAVSKMLYDDDGESECGIMVIFIDTSEFGYIIEKRQLLSECDKEMYQFLVSMKSYQPKSVINNNNNNNNNNSIMCKDVNYYYYYEKSGLKLEKEKNIINSKYYNIIIGNEYASIISNLIENNRNIPLLLECNFESNLNLTKNLSFVNPLNMISDKDDPMTYSSLRLLNEENAGGNSEFSEAFSFEILRRIFNNNKNNNEDDSTIILLKTEMEIKYWLDHWKMTDYMIGFRNNNNNKYTKIGVSVTRAMSYCFCDNEIKRCKNNGKCNKKNHIFTKENARNLLIKKLNGVNESTEGVLLNDEWQRQILFIWSMEPYITKLLKNEWIELNKINKKLINNTIVFIVTVNTKQFWWLFFQSKLKEPKYKFITKVKKKEKEKETRFDIAAA